MVSVCRRLFVAAAVLLLLPGSLSASAITSAPPAAPTADSLPATCEFRTINYITDSLPQLCGKSSWSSSNLTSSTKSAEDASQTVEGQVTEALSLNGTMQHTVQSSDPGETSMQATVDSGEPTSSTSNPTPTEAAEGDGSDLENGELNEASFLSFEEWKKQTLEKAGQANANIGNKKSGSDKKRDPESIQNNLDSLGDEGEIDLDFGAFRAGGTGEDASQASESKESNLPRDVMDQNENAGRVKRREDAGKTYKERFSYASFDAGATILKTHPGAKNSKAVLIENKDSYMLSECSAENKFLIIELSEDIWIDTLVLANYEFFSSMIRTFRVSVSDRYPVKMEKWKDLGTYEARNSREIQAFLIENPQIWARYLRIEFLSHYGNEYYCPLSLVRVHGTRMLESWKETEANGEDEDGDDENEQGTEEQYVPDAVADVVQEEERLNAELKEAQAAIQELVRTAEALSTNQFQPNSSQLNDVNRSLENASSRQMMTPWIRPSLLDMFNSYNASLPPNFCLVADSPNIKNSTYVSTEPAAASNPTIQSDQINVTTDISTPTNTGNPTITPPASLPEQSVSKVNFTTIVSNTTIIDASNTTRSVSEIQESISSLAASVTSKAQNSTSNKNKTSSTSSASAALPTIQESFFKAVYRRLQLLETNSTLSLKYIEEQSRILREAFSKVEKKQLQKTSTFLDTLNSTVLAELRGFRQQYDEIWQSTIISLESQREESRREILAISARLNILADEVVFQKRMSIVQSVLLLLCLGLVIFSRVSAAGQIDLPGLQNRVRTFGFPGSPIESPPESPEYRRTGSMRDRGQWMEAEHEEQQFEGSPISRSRSREVTPVSAYWDGVTPPSDEMDGDTGNIMSATSEHLELPSQTRAVNSSPLSWDEKNETSEPGLLPSPIRTPKKRKAFIRQQTSPSASGADHSELIEDTQDDGFSHELDWASQDPSSSSPEQQHFPSPPSEAGKPGFSIARKPLPALPSDG